MSHVPWSHCPAGCLSPPPEPLKFATLGAMIPCVRPRDLLTLMYHWLALACHLCED